MTNYQREHIAIAMERYELYLKTNINLITSVDMKNIDKIALECGVYQDYCHSCLDEVIEMVKRIYETLWLK